MKAALVLKALRRTPESSGKHDETHCVKQADDG